jgi:hypothetical protein
MAEITSASQEQSSGIMQVNRTITQMDQVTQQNAALVGEASAAAETLKGQADRLAHAVAVFRLGDDRQGARPLAARTALAGHASPHAALPAQPSGGLATPPARPAPSPDEDWKEF